jgi:tetratricopeptide (TPR) repeat protein
MSKKSMPKSVLKSARRLYRKKKFPAVISLLEGQIFRFRENQDFFALLGNACLYSGDLGGAFSYLKRSEQLDPQHIPSLLGLAVIAARRREPETAVRIWLHVLELEQRNRKARRGLDMMRKTAAREDGDLLPGTDDLKKLYPSTGLRPGRILVPLLALAGLALAGLMVTLLPADFLRKQTRPGIAEIVFAPQHPALIGQGVDAAITMSEEEVADSFEQAKSYLLDYRDNLAVREVNRIILSNASAYAREKASLLKTFAEIPDFSTLRDNFTWQEVTQQPQLYEDCFVAWSGKLANLRIDEDSVRFDLLVGYEHERELLGIVPVRLAFGVELENGLAVEVLGRITLMEGGFRLEGKSIHRLLAGDS